jgi:DNA-binding CsgD family transcriptional regulator
MYAVLITSLASLVLGIWFMSRQAQGKEAADKVGDLPAIPRPVLLRIIAITAGAGFAYAIIRLMAFGRIYENPDTLYLAFCLLLFLMTEAVVFVVLRQMRLRRLPLHILAAALVLLLNAAASVSSWVGHRGLFIFMGLVTVFVCSFLLPLLYAWRRSLPVTQTISASQFGISLGILAATLGSRPLGAAGFPVEIQIVALFVFIALFCAVFFVVVLGARRAPTSGAPNPQAASGSNNTVRDSPASDSAQTGPDRSFIELLTDRGATARQSEVALLAAKGYSIPIIAEKMVLSRKTVDNHLHGAYRALEIHSRQDLVSLYQDIARDHS